jgi:tRNA-binding protein
VGELKPVPIKSAVSLADVEKLDVRIGTIVVVEDMPNSTKLVRLRVDFGDHRRLILAGMKGERADLPRSKGSKPCSS